MPKVLSVSVAAYNLGEMIDECLNSFVKSEAIDKVEIIITDDGSRDDTAIRVQKYVDLYPNSIKLIKQQNAGPGSTVNSGILHATGKYFRMVDGDDWVNTENFTEFVNYLETCESDMVVTDYEMFNNQNKTFMPFSYNIIPKVNAKMDKVYLDVPHVMHALTFKLKIFSEYKIVVNNGFYSDIEYMLYPMQYVQTVDYFNKSVYVYRVARMGQSCCLQGYLKNINQHELILNNVVIKYLQNKNHYCIGFKKYIEKHISDMCDLRLSLLILSNDSKQGIKKVKEFVKYIHDTLPDVFFYFKKGKKVKLLVFSNYLLYSYVKKRVERTF